jgi:hypothetical protein
LTSENQKKNYFVQYRGLLTERHVINNYCNYSVKIF